MGWLLCRLGFHKWRYRMTSGAEYGAAGRALRQPFSSDRESEFLDYQNHDIPYGGEGAMRVCRRNCDAHETYDRRSGTGEWRR